MPSSKILSYYIPSYCLNRPEVCNLSYYCQKAPAKFQVSTVPGQGGLWGRRALRLSGSPLVPECSRWLIWLRASETQLWLESVNSVGSYSLICHALVLQWKLFSEFRLLLYFEKTVGGALWMRWGYSHLLIIIFF